MIFHGIRKINRHTLPSARAAFAIAKIFRSFPIGIIVALPLIFVFIRVIDDYEVTVSILFASGAKIALRVQFCSISKLNLMKIRSI